MTLDGIDIYGAGAKPINITLRYRPEAFPDSGDVDMSQQYAPADYDAESFDFQPYLKLFLDNLPAIIDMSEMTMG